MIDLHTHILCGMDDGARDADTSVRMLRMEAEQGVDAVVLTPHFYRHRETAEEFLDRRTAALEHLRERIAQLPEPAQQGLPKILPGAEVTWIPNLTDCRRLDKLCLNGTGYLLLELPSGPWDSRLVDQIYDLMTVTGLTPVLAHLDRYRKMQKASQFREILSLEVPVQISSELFLHLTTRSQGFKALQQYAHVVASDCHSLNRRPPNLGEAMVHVQKKLGRTAVRELNANARHFAGL